MDSSSNNQVPQLSADYYINRKNFPAAETAKFAGKCVAYSLDGRRIVASGDDWDDLERNLTNSGIDPCHVVESYVPPPDLVMLL